MIDPITKKPRYVGKTIKKKLRRRLLGHINEAKTKTHKNTPKLAWLRKLNKMGMVPKIKLIRKVELAEWEYWEKFYIAEYKRMGYHLVNSTEGGEAGCSKKGRIVSDETRKKLSNVWLRKKVLGTNKLTEDHKQKLRGPRIHTRGSNNYKARSIRMYNDLGVDMVFGSISEAEVYLRSLGFKASRKNIGQCLQGVLVRGKYPRKKVSGFKFEYK